MANLAHNFASEIGRAGGLAVRDRYGLDYLRALGSCGGQAKRENAPTLPSSRTTYSDVLRLSPDGPLSPTGGCFCRSAGRAAAADQRVAALRLFPGRDWPRHGAVARDGMRVGCGDQR